MKVDAVSKYRLLFFALFPLNIILPAMRMF